MPPRRAIGRTQAARTPFAVLVIAMLVAGVVGLLMFNTNMQQASFKATALQEQVNALTARQQSLNMELEALRDPQRLAGRRQGARHGRRPRNRPSSGSDGRVLGTPTPATDADAVRINPLPTPKPAGLKQKTVVVKVPPTTQRAPLAGSRADTRGSSTTQTGQGGRKSDTNAAGAQSGASH